MKAEAAHLRQELEIMKEARRVMKAQHEAVVLAQLKGGLARMQGATQELEHHKAAVSTSAVARWCPSDLSSVVWAWVQAGDEDRVGLESAGVKLTWSRLKLRYQRGVRTGWG